MNRKFIEALLFVAEKPLSLSEISDKIDLDESVTLRLVRELISDYENRGVIIRQVAGGFEMATATDCYEVVEKVAPKKYEKLSKSTRETITVVAFKQPVDRATIAKFRNVKNPDTGIDNALEAKLINQTDEGFVTTDLFLKRMGVNDIEELKEKLSAIDLPGVENQSEKNISEEKSDEKIEE